MIRIEQLSPEKACNEAQAIVSVYRDVWVETFQNADLGITRADLVNEFSELDDITARWQRRILNDPDRAVWVARGSDSIEIIGFCIARKGRDENELEFIFVRSEFQHAGIGKQLLVEAFDWLGGGKVILIDAAASNGEAIKKYQRMGFVLLAEVQESKVLKNGKHMPWVRLRRPAEF